jgi:hypothetical protein
VERTVKLDGYTDSQRHAAVSAFNARYGEMEQALWCLSVNSRASLLAGQSSLVVETLVWTIKSWWGVMGVRSETKVQMAGALAESLAWSPGLFDPVPCHQQAAAQDASELVALLVSSSIDRGVTRREYSLASKVMHWLLPWRVPVYDSFVRGVLGVPASWDHPQAYRMVAEKTFAIASKVDGNSDWFGTVEPLSPLRALDKLMWWAGGGDAGTAAEVRDPWRVIRELNLGRP